MKLISFLSTIASLLFSPVVQAGNAPSKADNFWPQWRGPAATGAAPLADPPVSWSESEHVKWKVQLPGSGDATPIVWDDRVFILTAIPTGKKPAAKSPEATGSDPGPGAGRRPGGRMNSETPDEAYQFSILCRTCGFEFSLHAQLPAALLKVFQLDFSYLKTTPSF